MAFTPAILQFNSSNWNVAQNVTLAAVDDAVGTPAVHALYLHMHSHVPLPAFPHCVSYLYILSTPSPLHINWISVK